MTPTLFLLNPFCRAGRGGAIWSNISLKLLAYPHKIAVIDSDWKMDLIHALDSDVRVFIAAGGDGTVHELLNALIKNKKNIPLDNITLGGIGLGSSNDFHKPTRNFIDGISTKINLKETYLRDVIQVDYWDADSVKNTKYCIVSGSIGIVAEANHYFNNPTFILKWLKKNNTLVAIIYTILKTIFRYRVFQINLSTSKQKNKVVGVTSLNILKTPYISGTYYLNIPICVNDGSFAVVLMENMNLIKMLKAFCSLSFRCVTKNSFFHNWSENSLEVNAKKIFPLELDGEIVFATKAVFTIFPERIRVCH